MIGTPAAASRVCSARTSRTWIQIITERPAGPAACPETSRNPGPRKNTAPDHPGDRTPGRWPGPGRRGRSGGCGPGRRAQEDPTAHNVHATIPMSDARGQRRTRTVPPSCTAEPVSAAFFPGASPRVDLLPKAITGEEGAPLSAKSGRPDPPRVRSVWRQQRADGRVAGWSGNAGAARTVTFTDVAFEVPTDNGRR
jgi:hypothetical protein